MKSGLLVIIRHGESEWNATGQWTGLTDVHLTDKGRHEGTLMGIALKDIHFDYAYTSRQIRTQETLDAVMTTHPQNTVPHEAAAALNERDYGDLTGKNKWEVKEEMGEEAFNGIRRSWDYPVPRGETLKMVYERSVPFYKETIVPRLLKGENVLIAAHGNSIRSLMKYIENISDEGVAHIEMVFGTALLYHVDEHGRQVDKDVRSIDTELPPA
jgi:2,3-bisphosphoglycerate-dependent phosphoglycerate mutase